jgi:hypothetical protein
MTNSFTEYWSVIQSGLVAGQPLRSRSAANRAKTVFHILKTESSGVIVKPENGDPRQVPKRDFERVFELWDDYKKLRINRHELGFTQHSTYIITLLYWAESNLAASSSSK